MKSKLTLVLLILLCVSLGLIGCTGRAVDGGTDVVVSTDTNSVEPPEVALPEEPQSASDVVGTPEVESSEVGTPGSEATIGVTLTVESPIFSVTVPATASIVYDSSTGSILAPDLPITNYSAGPITVTNLTASTKDGNVVDLMEFYSYEPPISRDSTYTLKFTGGELDKKTAKALDGQLIVITVGWYE